MQNLSSVNKHPVSKLVGLFKVLFWFKKYSAFSINTQSLVFLRNEGYSMSVCTIVLNKSSKLDLTQTEMNADGSCTQENTCFRVSLRNQYLTDLLKKTNKSPTETITEILMVYIKIPL